MLRVVLRYLCVAVAVFAVGAVVYSHGSKSRTPSEQPNPH